MRIILTILFFSVSFSELEAKKIFKFFPTVEEVSSFYKPPTADYVRYWGWETIATGLKSNGVSMVYRNLFDRVHQREESGFIGYHGSTQQYRIYQDIIRVIFEEILEIPIRNNFQFFRIPRCGHYPLLMLEQSPLLYSSDLFLCLNFSLYGNFNDSSSCSYYYFSQNASDNYLDYRELICPLFELLEIDQSQIDKLFHIGEESLCHEKGVLYCLYDMSHFNLQKPYYFLTDSLLVHSEDFGSNIRVFKGFREMLQNQKAICSGHVRLLMTNRHTLNPFSSLYVYRYELTDSKIVNHYMSLLRETVRKFDYSAEGAKEYRKFVLRVWNIDL